ncbi:MAG: histidinol-phosphatase [Desulfobacteraceae bacterium]
MTICNDRFPQGSRWVRSDFHLHTNADKEFFFTGEADYYNSNYVQALTDAGIEVGVITNHNKFDFGEFKALKKTAKKKGSFLLPGMELSVNDGSNGIHTLVVFSDEWLENGNDYINQFLNVTFEGKTPEEYENENGRSSFGLIETIKKLEGYNRDFFLVFAHVEDKSGLWHELDGGRLQELGRSEVFCRRSLAFQKVRTHDEPDRKGRVKVKDWLGQAYPAEVEGSDPKSIEQIGKGEACYLKIGDFTFEAIKYALSDYKYRVSSEPHRPMHSHIKSVSFEGGVLDGKFINFSSELNTLIGIRGSGKSSILEAVRYALEIEFGEKALDIEYKRKLVDEHILGSGGKITLHATDQRGQQYEIRRISREKPDVYVNGILQPGISIRDTVLHKPLYFGQKDLSSTGDGFEKDLVEKLVGEKLIGVRQRIAEQGQKIVELVRRLEKLSNTSERKSEYEAKKQDAEFRLKFYKDHGVEQKLQKQVDFDSDSRKCTKVITFVQSYLEELESFIDQHEDDLNNQKIYTSKQNDTFFTDFFACYDNLLTSFNSIKAAFAEGRKTSVELQKKTQEFAKVKDGLKEEFAEIERKLSEHLRASGVQAIRPDEFRNLRKTVDQATQMLNAIAKEESNRSILKDDLLKELVRLNDLWHEEFKSVKSELDKINQSHSSLSIDALYKGDKTAFSAFMKDVFRGSRLREATFQNLTEKFVDFGAMFKDRDGLIRELGTSAQVFLQYFDDNIEALLTWQVPNRFIIKYRGKELKHHSLGQRASALILFVLSQQENDVFLIDQPEDDLDNQTIYEDVIKLIRQLKPKTQFIFATHNANFPVLGDAEQIIACSYSDDKMQSKSGGIDCPGLQQEIVNIMEGGEEAFLQRKRRYEIWKLQNS